MNILKKITFVPFLIISMIAVVVFANQLLQDPLAAVIGFQPSSVYTLLYLSLSLVLTGFFFALIVCLSLSWEIPLFAAGFSSLIPLMMIQNYPVNVIFAVGFFVSFIVGLLMLLQKLKSYLTFSPRQLLSPAIGLVTLLFSLTISVAAYQDVSAKIEKDGFTVPDQLIDMAIKFSGADSLGATNPMVDPSLVKGETTAADPQAINISPEMIQYIRQNPSLLKQFNVTPEQFEAYAKAQQKGTSTTPSRKTTPTSPTAQQPVGTDGTSDLISGLVKTQLNESLKPYASFMAPLIAVLLFSTISFFNYLLSFFVPLFLWILFSIMEKTGFVHFVKEMREVKKLVV